MGRRSYEDGEFHERTCQLKGGMFAPNSMKGRFNDYLHSWRGRCSKCQSIMMSITTYAGLSNTTTDAPTRPMIDPESPSLLPHTRFGFAQTCYPRSPMLKQAAPNLPTL